MFGLKKAAIFFLLANAVSLFLWADDNSKSQLQDYFLSQLKKDYALYLKNKGIRKSDSDPNVFLLSVLTSRCTMPQGKSVALIELINPTLKGYFEYEWAENPYSGNLSWISKTISGFHYSDAVEVPQSLTGMDQLMAENQGAELDELVSKTADAFAGQDHLETNLVRSSDHSLQFYCVDEEYIACHKRDDASIVLSADGKNGVRRFYDSRMRLSKKENWRRDGEKGFVIDNTHYYSYESDQSIPLSCIVEGVDFSKKIEYNLEGKVASSVLYDKAKIGGEKTLLKKESVSWIYNENGKIVEKESQNFTYRNNSRKVKYCLKRKEVYEYKSEDREPDYFYYENDKLRLSTVHTSDVDFMTTSIFDSGFTVESYYESGMHKKDVFLVNGVVRRSASYE